MNPMPSVMVQKNSGWSSRVIKGQRIRVAGKSVVDFVAFNLHDLKERFDQARTKTNQAKLFISTGDQLISKINNSMLTIVEDTFQEGRHDLQKGMCSKKRFELVAKGLAKRVFAEGIDPNPNHEKKKSSDLVADMVLLVLPLHNQQFYFDVIWEKAVFLISK